MSDDLGAVEAVVYFLEPPEPLVPINAADVVLKVSPL